MSAPVTASDFKARFVRDFPYGTDPKLAVTDTDVEVAIADAASFFNPALFSTDETKGAYLLLSAYCLVENIKAAGGLGLSMGYENSGSGAILSKSAGPTSVTQDFPEQWKKTPAFAPFLRNDYGIRYLQLASTRLAGGMFVLSGWNDTGPTPTPTIPVNASPDAGVGGGDG